MTPRRQECLRHVQASTSVIMSAPLCSVAGDVAPPICRRRESRRGFGGRAPGPRPVAPSLRPIFRPTGTSPVGARAQRDSRERERLSALRPPTPPRPTSPLGIGVAIAIGIVPVTEIESDTDPNPPSFIVGPPPPSSRLSQNNNSFVASEYWHRRKNAPYCAVLSSE